MSVKAWTLAQIKHLSVLIAAGSTAANAALILRRSIVVVRATASAGADSVSGLFGLDSSAGCCSVETPFRNFRDSQPTLYKREKAPARGLVELGPF
jgi:hypothetical protein